MKFSHHFPKKRFGQNFLIDESVIAQIIGAIAPKSADLMVEIGPGLGAITYELLASLAPLHLIEIDRDLIAYWQNVQNAHVHAADALTFNFGALTGALDQKIRVVGNLPYNISTPLLFHLSTFATQIEDQHFMLQKEVVERMVAPPGSKTYGRLSVMLQWRYHMEMLFTIPPTAFDPAPKVHSALVRMIPIAHPLACDASVLEHVVKTAFSMRRKTIRNSLASLFSENDLVDAGINPQDRPESVSVEGFVALSRQHR